MIITEDVIGEEKLPSSIPFPNPVQKTSDEQDERIIKKHRKSDAEIPRHLKEKYSTFS